MDKKRAKPSKEKKPISNASIWNKDNSDFICLPQFHNSLPNAPSGPYLKNIELLHPYHDFAEYNTSSLEKNYIWQPHFGPDLGLRLDLVDQEAILNPEYLKNEDKIDGDELRLLKMDPQKGRGKFRSEGQPEEKKPWWLRNTTYLENNLYVSVVQVKNDVKRQREVDLDYVSGLEAYTKSFEAVEINEARLIAESKKCNTEITWSIPLTPGLDVSTYLALGRFDEDPEVTLENLKEDKAENKASEMVTEENEEVFQCILANIRQIEIKEEDTRRIKNSFSTSLVLPSSDKYVEADPEKEEKDEKEEKVTEEEDKDEDKAEKDDKDSNSTLFKWFKDYTMEVNTKRDDSFILTVDVPSSSGSSSASATASSIQPSRGTMSYHPIKSRLELRKTTDTQAHQAVVTRRELIANGTNG